jgi:hypothetical protein
MGDATARRKSAPAESAAERQMRDQEVLRAKRELAAYFKGLRTEREARAALKTIKAFVRARERQDAQTRPSLPGVRTPKRAQPARKPKSKPRRSRSRAAAPPAPGAPPATNEPANN